MSHPTDLKSEKLVSAKIVSDPNGLTKPGVPESVPNLTDPDRRGTRKGKGKSKASNSATGR